MPRRALLIVLCEDRQHQSFVIRLLKKLGYSRRDIRELPVIAGKGSGAADVLKNYPAEVQAHRSRASFTQTRLVVMIDADNKPVIKRYEQFDETLDSNNPKLPTRQSDEYIAILVPKWNIETWIHYLSNPSLSVDETKADYHKLKRERECDTAVARMVEFLNSNFPSNSPDSLQIGANEIRGRILKHST